MKNFYSLLLTCLLIAGSAHAQLTKADEIKKSLETQNKDTVAWIYNGVFNLGVNEGFLHNSTSGGEVASLTINGLFSGHLDRLNGFDIWSNNLELVYGLYYAYSNSFVPRKTDDRIDFTSKYGMKVDTGKNFYITGLFNFRSQFTKGYDYSLPLWDTGSTSAFFSPAYFTLAAGAEYRRGSDISLFLSPVAGRVVLANKYYTSRSPQGAFGIPYNENILKQLGAYFSGRYVVNISKNMIYKTRLDLYCNYLAKDTKDSLGVVIKKDNPGNISFLQDNIFAWKLSKYVSLTLGATFIYDNNIPYVSTYVDKTGVKVPKNEPGQNLGWLQVKQVFTLGWEYKF